MKKTAAFILACVLTFGIFNFQPVSADDPPPANLLEESGFEGYSAGAVLGGSADSYKWHSNSGAASWFDCRVSNTYAHTGSQSLRVLSRYNLLYRTVTGLAPNTDYVFTFWYLLDSDANYTYTVIFPGDAEVNASGGSITPTLLQHGFNASGDGQWKRHTITFNTKNNTTVCLGLKYSTETSTGGGQYMYLDDISLYKAGDILPDCLPDEAAPAVKTEISSSPNLTVSANTLCGNRVFGWFDGDTLVSREPEISADFSDLSRYSLNIINNNVLEAASFEGYAAGHDLSSVWHSSAVVSGDYSMSGRHSLKAGSAGLIYRELNGLEAHSLYKLSFSFMLPSGSSLTGAALIPSSVTPSAANMESGQAVFKSKYYNEAGTGVFKTFEYYFETGEDENYYLCFNFTGTALYLDDLCILKTRDDGVIANSYFNTVNTYGWKASSGSIGPWSDSAAPINGNLPNGVGNGVVAAFIPSAEFSYMSTNNFTLLAGKTYKISFWLFLPESYPTKQLVFGDPNYNVFLNFGFANVNAKTALYENSGVSVNYKRYSMDGTLLENYNDDRSIIVWNVTTRAASCLGKWNRHEVTVTVPKTTEASFCLTANPSSTSGAVDGLFIDNVEMSVSGTETAGADIDTYAEEVGSAISLESSPALRFKERFSKELFIDDFSGYSLYEIGGIAIKESLLAGSELTLNGSYGGAAPQTSVFYQNGSGVPFSQTKRTVDYAMLVNNIPVADYANNYAMRSYIKLMNQSGDVKVLYMPQRISNILDVGQTAYNDKDINGNFVMSETDREYIKNNIFPSGSYTNLNVLNNGTGGYDDYMGMTGTVYHCTTYMHDSQNRDYTDEMAQIEFDRLQDSGIKMVRTIFRSTWAGGTSSNFTGWNFETTEMQAVYRWALEMQERDIDIAINAGWHMQAYIDDTSWYIETPYLFGNGEDYYGESNGVDFTGLTAEEIRLKKASLRYGEWVSRALLAFRAHGVNNVKYVLTFTEPSYTSADKLEGYYADEWITLATGLHDTLVKNNLRSSVEIIGPNQGSITSGEGLLNYILTSPDFDRDVVDIYTAHFYPRSASIYDDEYMDICDNVFGSYRTVMNRNGCQNKFIVDEFFASSNPEFPLGKNCGWAGTQTVVGIISAMKNRMNGLISWQFSDQLWTNQTNTGGEFVNGFHMVGMMPSLLTSYIPKPQYYGVNLVTKYMSDGFGTSVIDTNYSAGNGLYIGATKLSDDNITVVVANTSQSPQLFNINFSAAVNRKFYRLMFDPKTVNPTSEAKLAGSDNEKMVSNLIADSIPKGGILVYTTKQVGSLGEDVDIDMEEQP